MAGPERARRRGGGGGPREPRSSRGAAPAASLAGLAAVVLLGACSAIHRDKSPAAPQTLTSPPPPNPSAPPTEPPPPPPQTAAPPTGAPKATGSEAVLIDPGGAEESETSLVAAARAERARRRDAGLPVAVVTDRNLSQYATGSLTFQDSPLPAEKAAPSPGAEAASANRDEATWRAEARAIRGRWRAAHDAVARLEEEAAALRQRFYAEDDAYVRDRQIKPEWDRALDAVSQARRDVERERQALATLLEEGRRAGAFPGWLREGEELEPHGEGPRDVSPDPMEPTIARDESREPDDR